MAQVLWWAGGLTSGAVAAALWAVHPARLAAPDGWWAAGAALAGGALLAARWPGWAVAALLACLPLADDAVWSGWQHLSVWDAAVAAVLSGLWCREAWRGERLDRVERTGQSAAATMPVRGWWWLAAGWWVVTLVAVWRAPVPAWGAWAQAVWGDAAAWAAPWAGAKALLQASLLLVALRRQPEVPRLLDQLSWGMVCGLLCCVGVLIWERMAQVGLLALGAHYRTTAWFWEMRLGGGALDAYLAMAMPFAWWALRRIAHPVAWGLMAGGMVATVYAVVTTYSRGVMLTAVVIAWCVWRMWRDVEPAWPWRRWGRVLVGLLVTEACLLLVLASAATDRLRQSGVDAMGRWQHWVALAQLPQGAAERLWGIGIGQIPVRHASEVPGGEWPGRLSWHAPEAPSPAFARLEGAPTRNDLRGRMALAQRVPASAPVAAAVRLRWRATQATAVRLSWCDQHLLYEGHCLEQRMTLPAGPDFQTLRWTLTQVFEGDVGGGTWRPGSPQLFKLSVEDVGAGLDLTEVQAEGPDGTPLLRNGQFQQGLAHWFAVSRAYFQPWHADNLYLELAVERGVLGLLCGLALAGLALRTGEHHSSAAPWRMATVGLLLIGVVISAFEFARIAFLAQFLLLGVSHLGGDRARASS